MPLYAQVDETPVIAPLCDEERWAQIRHAARSDRARLRMGCCGHPALARVSKLGLKHFAHRPGSDCDAWTGETIHHLHLKSELLRALSANDLDARPEVAGDGWRADVLARCGSEQVVFEVQWSSQTIHEFRDRTLRYAHAGLRTVWLVRRPVAGLLDRDPLDLPCFEVTNPAPGEYRVLVGGRALTVGEFIDAWATGNLRLTPNAYPLQPALEAHRFSLDCPHCQAPTAAVAFADNPPTALCGLALADAAQLAERHHHARHALARQLRGRRLDAGRMHALDDTALTQVPWVQACEHCAGILEDRDVRRALRATLTAAGDTEIIYRHESVRTPTADGRHWCFDAEGSCAPSVPVVGPAAVAQQVADALTATGEAPTVRASASAVATRPDMALVDLAAHRTALLCCAETPGSIERALWEARLSARRTLQWLSCGDQFSRGEAVPLVRAERSAGAERLVVAVGETKVGLDEWAPTLAGRGPKLAGRLRAADTQRVSIYRLELRCWRCSCWFSGVAASGSWQSRCGKATYAEIKLWDTAIGSEVKRLLDSQQLSVPATVRPCRSQMQGVFGADRDGYANHCPRCKAMFGQVFLDGELQRATSRGLRPIMTTDLRLTTRAITHSNWEYLHFCAACA